MANDPTGHPRTATALIPQRTPGLGGARAWSTMPADERRRRAVAACQTRDLDALWDLADAWLTLHGKAGAAVSQYTRRNYRRGIATLLDAWQQENLLHPRRDAGALWLREMEDQGLKPATVTVRLAAARCLYAALRWAGATEADPLRDARPARDPVPAWEKRQPYSDDDLQALLRHAVGDDRALVLLGAHAGLRVSEMLALRWRDVDLGRRQLRVVCGKGGKPRTVTMSRSLCAALCAVWDTGERVVGERAGYVLPYATATSARRRLERLCALARVEPRAIHSLRHSAGTRVYAETASLEEAARHLGHTSLETSRVYAKWSNRRLQATVGEW